jgi:hypothetical protein
MLHHVYPVLCIFVVGYMVCEALFLFLPNVY